MSKLNDTEIMTDFYIACNSCDMPMEMVYGSVEYVYRCVNSDCDINK